MNIEQASDMVDLYMKADVPVFLHGAPGIGKSQAVHQVGKARDWNVMDFYAILRESIDLRGLPAVDIANKVTEWLPPSELPQVERDGEEGIFFMDELNAAPASVQAACFSLILERKVGNYVMPEGWRIVAAGNRQQDQAAAGRLLTPLANRMAHIDVEPHVETFVNYGLATGKIHPLVLGYIRFSGLKVLHDMSGQDLRAFPTPRSWEAFSDTLPLLNLDQDIGMVQRALEGLVGKAQSTEFLAFTRTYNGLPSFDSIVNHPDSATIPDEPSGRHAVTSMLAHRITPKQLDAAYAYMGRVSKEFETKFMFDLIARDKHIDGKPFQNSKTWVKWGAANMNKFQSNGKW